MDIARRHSVAVIEDACQAHGATYKGRQAGSFGDGCFSFYATKNMTTGEGGMITTDDEVVADRARLLRDHGQTSRYHTEAIGYNLRLTEVASAIGEVQLGLLREFNERRRANARYFSNDCGASSCR
jgi:dTDP-4-amino-4,6-dideoxygalactose transaminase